MAEKSLPERARQTSPRLRSEVVSALAAIDPVYNRLGALAQNRNLPKDVQYSARLDRLQRYLQIAQSIKP